MVKIIKISHISPYPSHYFYPHPHPSPYYSSHFSPHPSHNFSSILSWHHSPHPHPNPSPHPFPSLHQQPHPNPSPHPSSHPSTNHSSHPSPHPHPTPSPHPFPSLHPQPHPNPSPHPHPNPSSHRKYDYFTTGLSRHRGKSHVSCLALILQWNKSKFPFFLWFLSLSFLCFCSEKNCFLIYQFNYLLTKRIKVNICR